MDLENKNIDFEGSLESELSLREILHSYIIRWKWFVLSVFLTLSIAFLILRYTVPVYQVSASILIQDDNKGGGFSELDVLEELGIESDRSANVDNEIVLLKSRTLMMNTIKDLNLNVSYFDLGSLRKYFGLREKELYGTSPLKVTFLISDSTLNESSAKFKVLIKSETEFSLVNGEEEEVTTFGERIGGPLGEMIITPTSELNGYIGKEIKVVVIPVVEMANNYRHAIVMEIIENTSVIELSLKDAVKQKAIDILDNLIVRYNDQGVKDQNMVAENTGRFIQNRLNLLTADLDTIEEDAERFKVENHITDITLETSTFLGEVSTLNQNILETNANLKLVAFIIDYVEGEENEGELIPVNLGYEDAMISGLNIKYNDLLMQRNRILRGSSENNPIISKLNVELESLRNNLRQSLKNLQSSLMINKELLSKQESSIHSKLSNIPKQERDYRGIQRRQQIKETLFLMLLQKREETAISLAATALKAKVIDKAHGADTPVAPNRKMVYIGAFLLALIIPTLIIYLVGFFDTKIHGKKDFDGLKIPYIGDIPLSDDKESKLVIKKGDQTSIAEAFRLLRTNVRFILQSGLEEQKMVFVTSTISKEGKSFVALNLAASLAVAGKKTLLIGMDLRAPKVLQYLGMKDTLGLTRYITDSNVTVEDVILSVPDQENLDILPSGIIPPNPAELLMHPRVEEMLAKVSQDYDYVIVDTAPVGMVADTLLLSKYADLFIYVARANYLDKRMLGIVESLYKEKKLPKLSILVNGVDSTSAKGYGYGYGYGYGALHEKKKSKWSRLFGKKN